MLVKHLIRELMKCDENKYINMLINEKLHPILKIKEGSFTVNFIAPTHEEYMEHIHLNPNCDTHFPLPEKE